MKESVNTYFKSSNINTWFYKIKTLLNLVEFDSQIADDWIGESKVSFESSYTKFKVDRTEKMNKKIATHSKIDKIIGNCYLDA